VYDFGNLGLVGAGNSPGAFCFGAEGSRYEVLHQKVFCFLRRKRNRVTVPATVSRRWLGICSVLHWLELWFPRILLVLYSLGPAIEFHGLATDFETYDHLIGSAHMCNGSPAHCSWEEFLISLANNTAICITGVAILVCFRGRERELALWQWTAMVFVNAVALAAIDDTRFFDE